MVKKYGLLAKYTLMAVDAGLTTRLVMHLPENIIIQMDDLKK